MAAHRALVAASFRAGMLRLCSVGSNGAAVKGDAAVPHSSCDRTEKKMVLDGKRGSRVDAVFKWSRCPDRGMDKQMIKFHSRRHFEIDRNINRIIFDKKECVSE